MVAGGRAAHPRVPETRHDRRRRRRRSGGLPTLTQNGSIRFEFTFFHWPQSIASAHLMSDWSATAFGVDALRLRNRGCAARPTATICDGLRRRCGIRVRGCAARFGYHMRRPSASVLSAFVSVDALRDPRLPYVTAFGVDSICDGFRRRFARGLNLRFRV